MLPVRFRIVVAGVDVAPVGLSGAIHWGRDGVDSQPAGAVATVTIEDVDGTVARAAEVLAPFDVYVTAAGVERRRFAGTVTDCTVDHAAGETTIVASDELGRLARTYIGDEPWPAELDGARVERILTLAGVDMAGAGPWQAQSGTWQSASGTWRVARAPNVDAGAVTITPRDVDRKSVLELAQQTAADAWSVLFTDRAGLVNYRDSAHRPGSAERTLPAGVFDTEATFTRGTAGMTNRVRYGWGTSDPQDVVTVLDQPSIDRYGVFDAQRGTQLAVQSEADSLARRLVAVRRTPRWSAPALMFDTAALDPDADDLADVAWLLDAGCQSAFAVTGIAPPDPSFGGTAYLVVEGGVDTLDGNRLVVEFGCSSLRMVAPPTTWDDVPAGDRWADIPADVAWLDVDDYYAPTRKG